MNQRFAESPQAAPTPARSPSGADAPVAGAVVIVVLGLAMYMVEPLYVGALADSLGFDSRRIGLLVGLEIASVLVVTLAAPWWLARSNPKVMAFVAVAAMLAGNALSLAADSFAGLAACRMLVGFAGSGPAYTLGMRLLAAQRHPERAYSIAVLAQVGYAAVGLAAMPYFLASGGTNTLFLLWLVMALIALPFLRRLPARLPTRGADVPSGGAARAPRARVELGIVLLWNVGLGALWAYVDRIGREMSLDGATIGFALSTGMVVGMLASAQAAWMSDRFGTRWPLWVMIAAHLAVFAALGTELAGWMFVAALWVFNYTWNLSLPYLLGSIARADASGGAAALIPAAQTAGNTLGPLLGGLIAAGGDYTRVLLVPVACHLLMAAALVVLAAFGSRAGVGRAVPGAGRSG